MNRTKKKAKTKPIVLHSRGPTPKPNGQYLCGEIIVDRAVREEDASLASRVKVHETLHARLAIVDQSKNK
eukprot:CAMPEP_0185737034 /NCGR_PEP_ID=MMETSP1171-20130828/29482_1 /TAXON_ID=374046 /ORGANISM="Helicotheca tamensis, Strain CCMP826" /LENGTH=69 /DNA_ID=CAMNT_0028407843 /DNA_START=35 /DNA_END=241 /DNA_ORIENTATION=-